MQIIITDKDSPAFLRFIATILLAMADGNIENFAISSAPGLTAEDAGIMGETTGPVFTGDALQAFNQAQKGPANNGAYSGAPGLHSQPGPRNQSNPLADNGSSGSDQGHNNQNNDNQGQGPGSAGPLGELDSDGLPWDSRINTATKTKTKDGVYRLQQKLDRAFVEQIKMELRAQMNGHAGQAGQATSTGANNFQAGPGGPGAQSNNDQINENQAFIQVLQWSTDPAFITAYGGMKVDQVCKANGVNDLGAAKLIPGKILDIWATLKQLASVLPVGQ